jgi:hypothetical protein
VVSFVTEVECGVVFVNANVSTVTHTTLTEMGHPQETPYLKIDNSTADATINKTLHFYWIQDRVEHGQFDVSWAAGDTHMHPSDVYVAPSILETRYEARAHILIHNGVFTFYQSCWPMGAETTDCGIIFFRSPNDQLICTTH